MKNSIGEHYHGVETSVALTVRKLLQVLRHESIIFVWDGCMSTGGWSDSLHESTAKHITWLSVLSFVVSLLSLYRLLSVITVNVLSHLNTEYTWPVIPTSLLRPSTALTWSVGRVIGAKESYASLLDLFPLSDPSLCVPKREEISEISVFSYTYVNPRKQLNTKKVRQLTQFYIILVTIIALATCHHRLL